MVSFLKEISRRQRQYSILHLRCSPVVAHAFQQVACLLSLSKWLKNFLLVVLQTCASVVRITHAPTGGGEVVLADGRRFCADSIIVSSAAVANPILLPEGISTGWKPPLWKGTRLVAFESCRRNLPVEKLWLFLPNQLLWGQSTICLYRRQLPRAMHLMEKNLIYVSVRG